MKLTGKRALVTGASQGFGLAVAKEFVTEGARVMLCSRTARDLERARDDVRAVAQTADQVWAMPADVSRADDVRDLVRRATDELGGLDVLVCNAGVYGPKGPIDEVDWSDWQEAFAINLFGTVLSCREALPIFRARGSGKILLLSGGGATKPLPNLSAYAASKAAVVRFGETLAEEVRELGIQVNAIAPGALNTRLLDEVIAAGPEKIGHAFYQQCLKQKREGGAPLERGAALAAFLASDASGSITGKLISAVWDPWESLGSHEEDLRSTDIYTLRRIAPEDRGRKWE
jgi:NAD(P)-dependent dehydrogenase (short-subunit alcohol dehydrogenase family)